MRGTGTLRKSAVIAAVCLAVMCLPGYSEPTPEQVAERTELLLDAIKSDNLERAKLCIKLGANVNAEVYSWEVVNGGWQFTTDKNKVGSNRVETFTLLAYALSTGTNENIVELLIKAGADVNAKDDYPYGCTALMYVINNDQKDIAELLIKAGADSDAALKWAVINRASSETKFLIELGANVNATDSDGLTLLTHAILYGYNDIADLLRAAGAKE